jgi:hypothetical protein
MMRTKKIVLLLGVLAVALTGCQRGPEFAPVEGTVTKEGKPLADVIVEFHPDVGTLGPRSRSAPTDQSGHYRLLSYRGSDDGAVVGAHRACIFDSRLIHGDIKLPPGVPIPEDIQKEMRERNKEARSSSRRVPPSYGHPNETPLRVEVRPGSQVIDLEIK